MRDAILAGVNLNQDNFDEMIEECINLCNACDINIKCVITQTSRSIDKNTVFRSGKLDELKEAVSTNEVDLVVFLNRLSLNVLSRISDYIGSEVIDRTTLILDIFASRARTKEAMIQTEMARLKYNLPRYLKENMDTDKARGGTFNNRGAGETRRDLVKRTMEGRLAELKKELVKIEKERKEKANHRNKSMLKKVSLVGYTNAGKSSLMNALLNMNNNDDKVVFEKDMLFATLDTSVRKIKYENYEFLLFDTVGFVSDLPHDLIEAFHSTLSAAKEADLLLNVMDYSNKNYNSQKLITLDTLNEIGVHDTPILDVYNKCDLADSKGEYPLEISCKTKEGLDDLLKTIVHTLYPNECEMLCLIPYHELGFLSEFQNKTKIEIIEETNDGQVIKISGPNEFLKYFKKYHKEI